MAISSPGIGSNLDVTGIVNKLMQVEAQPLQNLNTKEAAYNAKLTAYGTLKGALSAFQSSIKSLNDPSKYLTVKGSSSNSSVATVSVDNTASAGTHSINVTKVAQSQRLVAVGQGNSTAAIGASGSTTTITFDFGTISDGNFTEYDSDPNSADFGSGGTYDGATFTTNGSGAKTVTIDSSNNNLIGIRDAINKAGIGVTASVVNDGGENPYRLVLASTTPGAANSLKISVSGDQAISDLLSHDPAGTQNLQQTSTGQNTELSLDGIFLSKSTNVISDVIQGLTLNVQDTGTSTISLTNDTSSISTAATAFAKAYNDLNKTLKDLSAYDPKTKTAAALQGDTAVRTIQSQLRSMLGSSVTTAGSLKNLSQVGFSFKSDGSMTLDTTKLNAALSKNPNDVAALFAESGTVSDSQVKFVSKTALTMPGNYALVVNQMATRGYAEGAAVASLVIDDTNNTMDVTVDGTSTTVTLANGTYASAKVLAAEIQSKINGSTTLSSGKKSVTVTEADGYLTVTSNAYGSSSAVELSAAVNLFGISPLYETGVDVAGTMQGVDAKGDGQYLTGDSGSGADGLKVLIGEGDVGYRGTVSFSRGFAYQLDHLVDVFLGSKGTIASRTDGINSSIEDIGKRRETLSARLTAIEARYRAQFTALDTLMSNMTSTSNYLTQQLAKL